MKDFPATTLARQAIDTWLADQARMARFEAIAAYAKRNAGTEFDLDPTLEAAGIEFLLSASPEMEQPPR